MVRSVTGQILAGKPVPGEPDEAFNATIAPIMYLNYLHD
jgi:hypothetical protein